jgi:hypothetical protein
VRFLFLEGEMVVVQLEGKTASAEGADECNKKSAPVGEKPVGAAEAREKVVNLVRSSAGEITAKLIAVAKEGQLGHVKYLFEMAGIHPPSPETATSKPEESLVYRWLQELGVPTGTQDKNGAREGGTGERIL